MADGGHVLDASVLLAVIFRELNSDEAEKWIAGACMSAVNFSEVIAKLAERGSSADEIGKGLAEFELDIRPFDQQQARDAGLLRPQTRALGLSFADRACLALAAGLELPVATADRAWATLDLGIAIRVVR